MATEGEEGELILGEEDQVQLEDNESAAPEDEDLEIPSFTDEAEEQPTDTDLVKHLRNQVRERDKRLKEVEQGTKPKPVLGPKPDLWETCDGDADKFEADLLAWQDRKRQIEQAANAEQEAQRKQSEELGKVISSYNDKKAALPYKDKDDMEAVTLSALSDPQKEILIRIATDPAKLAYALGRNGSKLAALASLNVNDMASVAAFGAAVAKLDGELKMAKRRPTAAPDKPIRGAAPLASTNLSEIDKQLDKAAEKGDMAEIRRLRKLKEAKAA